MTNQIHVSIGDDLKEALQAFADARGITIAAAVRIILHDTLTKQD